MWRTAAASVALRLTAKPSIVLTQGLPAALALAAVLASRRIKALS
ncbi:MAG TPA: hypothetical protein VGT02_15930 [Methylomirabilota bacterium]|nr:hypothetical protein [Methylomirabilota bacterium]